MRKPVLCTIGHSTRPIDEFLELLNAHGVEKVAGVTTIPGSRHNPQYDQHREDLWAEPALGQEGGP